MRIAYRLPAAAALAVALLAAGPLAAQDKSRLTRDLTPVGGERGANAGGTIPAWDGGLKAPPSGWQPGQHLADPYAGDQPRLVITAANMEQHKAQLSEGLQAMLKAYPGFKLNVYPTRRSASFPEHVYAAVSDNVGRAKLVEGGNGVSGATIGVPFPMAQNGQEAIWNHLLRYRGEGVKRTIVQVAPTRGGDYTLVKLDEDVYIPYSLKGAQPDSTNNILLYFLQRVTGPARLAGEIVLVHETLNQIAEPRNAWTYNPGQRRVRRAPNVAYDNPGTASDGMRTTDQFDIFSGAIDRYEWQLVGKKEMIVPYNDYRLAKAGLPYEQIMQPGHLNPDLLRYELHRVYVVEAKLKGDTSHIYSRRTFYLDEDSWQALLVDQYDSRGGLWRVTEGRAVNYYQVPALWTIADVTYDLQAGRYIVIGLDNNEKPRDFNAKFNGSQDFTPDNLRREGTR